MAVAFDAVGPSSAGAFSNTVATVSWSHTCTGSERLLVAAVAVSNGTDTGITTTATYNGVSMTSVGLIHSNNGTAGYIQMFRLIAPATGANTVLVTASTSVSDLSAGSVSFTGVDQTTPLGTPVTAASTGTPTVAVTGTTAGNMVIDAVCNGSDITSSNQTQRWLRNTSGNSAAGNGAQSTAAAGGSVTMSYAVTSDWYGILGVEVLAVGGSSPQTTANLYPTSNTTTGTTWANTTNANGSGTGTTATFTTTTNGAVGTLLAAGYDAQTAMGGTAPTSIDSIALTVNEYVTSNVARYSSLTAQLYTGSSTALGSSQALTISITTSNTQTLTFTGASLPTWAQAADLRVMLTGTKSGTQASVWNVDTVGPMVITYTPAAGPTAFPFPRRPAARGLILR